MNNEITVFESMQDYRLAKRSKKCTKCGEVKMLRFFHKQSKGALGVCSVCKICSSAYSQKKYLKRRNSILSKRNNLDYKLKKREYDKQYATKNKDKIKDYQIKWGKKNSESISIRQKKYLHDNHEIIALRNKIYRDRPEYKEMIKDYYIKNKDKIQTQKKAFYKNQREELNDSYICQLLNISKLDCPKELVEAKRAQIILYREINQ